MRLIAYKHRLVALVFYGLFLSTVSVIAKEPVLETLVITNLEGDAIEYKVEVARTASQMQRGLMFRDTMPKDRGMLFIYKPERPATMWMKNTILSLDMIFIDSQGMIINIEENTTPFALDTIDSGGPVRAVLELNAGQTSKHRIVIGDRVRHPLFEEITDSPKQQ